MSSVTEAVTTRATRPRVPIATKAAATVAAARATTANSARTDPPDKGDTVINKVSFRFIFYFSSFAFISLAYRL